MQADTSGSQLGGRAEKGKGKGQGIFGDTRGKGYRGKAEAKQRGQVSRRGPGAKLNAWPRRGEPGCIRGREKADKFPGSQL